MQPKINWVENLKAFAILSVILGHIASPFSAFIYSWHIPLFFILAGFFIKFDLPIKDFILKDFKKLMIPYFIFALLGLVVEIMKRIALHREPLDYMQELKGIFIWMDITSLQNTYAFVLWFLPALFFARVFLFVINKYIKNLFIQSAVIFLLFIFSFYAELPFGVDNGLNAILFLFIGSLFFRFYQDNRFLYFLPFMLVGLYILFGVPSLDVASKSYGNILVNLLWAVSMSYIFFFIFKKLNFEIKILSIWGGKAMLLFITHPYTNNIAHIAALKINFGDWYLKLFISLLLLQIIIFIKQRFIGRGVFNYV